MTAAIVGTHPYADKFPMLSDSELDELAESIHTVGLLHPIVIDSDGLILDGRNRLEACNRAQVDARTEVYTGSDVAEYVIACNVTRRNMSTGARAMATALVLQADGRRENGRWKRGTVDITESGNTESQWRQRLTEAGIVLDFKPDLAPEVVSGAIKLNDAFTFIRKLRGQMVLDWWDFVDEPISVVTRVDEPGKPQRLIEERVALRASSAEDFLAFAREERRRAANDFTARNQTCEAVEWIASQLIENGHTFFPGWAASEFPEQPA